MKPHDLFNVIGRERGYITSGDSVQWKVKTDHEEKAVYLVFQESADKRDWINNFNFPKKIYKKQESCLRVSRGWGNAYKSCNDEIINVLIDESKKNEYYTVNIVGWSYGGALSLLAAEDYYFRTKKKANVCTFGAPKPLWGKKSREYVRSCINEIKQYSFINDIVVYLPPFLGYTRASTDKIGRKFRLKELFNPNVSRCIYGDYSLYKEGENDRD